MSETPDEAARLRAIAEREQQATKGPWAVVTSKLNVLKSSPFGQLSDAELAKVEAVRIGEEGDSVMVEYPTHVVDIVSVAGEHVFCTGHDYDEGGAISRTDADFAAHAREDVPYLLSLVSRQAQEIQELRSRLASALAEREEALLSIGGVQSDLRKADQEIQDLRTERDHERHEKETVAEAGQAMVKHLWSSRDALREALKGAAMTCVSTPGDRRVVIYFGDDLKRAQDCLKVLVSRELLAETPTEDR